MLKLDIKPILRILQLILILFGLFIFYQIMRKVFGSSWTTDDIALSLLMLIVGMLFTIAIILAQLYSDHNHLRWQFGSLAADFKLHIKKHK